MNLPVDPRSLLHTPRSVVIKDNCYWYHGVRAALRKMLETCFEIPDLLSLKINVGGISISKSSGAECWPILVEINELPRISPEIIGIYCGQGQPKSLESYLRDFVDELNDCISNGFLHNGLKLNVTLKGFIADSPARALLKSRFYCT